MKAPDILSETDGNLVLSLDKGLYPLDVIYGAAYVFIDRAYILLGKVDDKITVQLTLKATKSRKGGTSAEEMVGEFSNELLSQALRKKITRDNQQILETIVSQALAGATGAMVPSEFDDDDDDDLDFLDDPLGIAVPWEERFKKRGSAPAQRGPDTEKEEAGPGDSGGHNTTGADE